MEVEVVLADIPVFDPSPAFTPATLEDLVEVEVVIADIPALDPSPDSIPATLEDLVKVEVVIVDIPAFASVRSCKICVRLVSLLLSLLFWGNNKSL